MTSPIPIWHDPDPCPECGSLQVVKYRAVNVAICLDCDHSWVVDALEPAGDAGE